MNQKNLMMKRIGIVFLVCLFLALIYYQFVWKSTQRALENYNVEMLEDELLLEQTKAVKMKQMKQTIKKQKKANQGIIADYNNLQNEVLELNRILGKTVSYQMDFEDPTTDDKVIRRDIHISFQTKTYDMAKDILKELQKCTYRSLLKNVMISSDSSNLSNKKEVQVAVDITFFEGISDAAKAADLNKYVDDSATNGG